jgi:hypothetical protein
MIGQMHFAVAVEEAGIRAAHVFPISEHNWEHPLEKFPDTHFDLKGALKVVAAGASSLAEKLVVRRFPLSEGVFKILHLISTALHLEDHIEDKRDQAVKDAIDAAQWLCGEETDRLEPELFGVLLDSQRLMYSFEHSDTQILSEPVTINGITSFLRGRPDTISLMLRPPPNLDTLATSLVDVNGHDTRLAARVMFDIDVYLWEQSMAAAAENCTDPPLPSVPAPIDGIQSGIGGAVMVSGSGYQPNSSVTINGHSTPTLLGQFRADGQGAFVVLVDIAGNLGIGDHDITVEGNDPSGAARVQHWSVSVLGPPAIAQPGQSSSWRWWALAGFIVVIGIVAWTLVRRRRATSSPA